MFLSVSAVSAESNATDDSPLTMTDQANLTSDNDPGSFRDFSDDMDVAFEQPDKVFNLEKNYTFDESIDIDVSVIPIDYTDVTIDGQGKYVIDARGSARIFEISASNVTLKNIIFKNAVGTAVKVLGDGCTIDNCTFINNSNSVTRGGAIYWEADDGKVTNSVFDGNAVYGTGWDDEAYRGGAIYWCGQNGYVAFCNFTNNSAYLHAGAISWAYKPKNPGSSEDYMKSKNGVIYKCNFDNNTALYSGSAVTAAGEHISIIECNFTNNRDTAIGALIIENTATNSNVFLCNFVGNNVTFTKQLDDLSKELEAVGEELEVNYASSPAIEIQACGVTVDKCNFINNTAIKDENSGVERNYFVGALKVTASGHNVTLSNCNFTNNSADNFGAIEWLGENGTIENSNFTNNYAPEGNSGAIRWVGINGKVLDSNFTENYATTGGAISWEDTAENGIVSNSNFTGNYADTAGAIYWGGLNGNVADSNFTENHAGTAGSIFWEALNGNVLNSNFVHNYAEDNAGAIKWEAGDGTVSNSNFTDNFANAEAGAIMWNGDDGTVLNSTFTKNHADGDSGAIRWVGTNGNVSNSNFTDNYADTAGAINWADTGDNGIVSNSYFYTNSAENEGGAIKWEGFNGTLLNSTFDKNFNYYDGGAVYWTTSCGKILYCNFTNNYANWEDCAGGAIYWEGDGVECEVSYCNFVNNTALNETTMMGGAIHWDADEGKITYCNFTDNTADKGGAISVGGCAVILNCSFASNNATALGGAIYFNTDAELIEDSNFTENTAYEGGAVYSHCEEIAIVNSHFTKNTADEGGAIYNNYNMDIRQSTFKSNSAKANGGAIFSVPDDDGNIEIQESAFESNTAILKGGAIYTDSKYIDIVIARFNDNNATKGSAIYVGDSVIEFNIYDVEFGKNRANASEVKIIVRYNESYAPAGVTVDVYLIGMDNLANAIWTDASCDKISMRNITCEYKDTPYYADDAESPQPSVDTSENGKKLWISYMEYAQLLNVRITCAETGEVFYPVSASTPTTSTRPLMGARASEEYDAGLTDIYGKRTFELENLPKGTYKVEAFHEWDKYYTDKSSSDTFVVYDLEVSKTTKNETVYVGENIIYNITITNPGNAIVGDIALNDTYQNDHMHLVDFHTQWNIGGNHGNWILDDGIFIIDNELGPTSDLKVTSAMPAGSSVSLILIFKATKPGIVNNTASVTMSGSDHEINATSTNTVILPVAKLKVVKSADQTKLANNTLVNFTIVVTNAGPCNATDVSIFDEMPMGLTLEDGQYGVIDSKGQTVDIAVHSTGENTKAVEWKIPVIASGTEVSFWVVARTNGKVMGDITNEVYVKANENKTSNKTNITVYPVKLEIEKTPEQSVTSNNSLVNFTITVENKGFVDAHDVVVSDLLPDTFIYDDSGVLEDNGAYVDNLGEGVWNVSRIYSKENSEFEYYVSFWITAYTNGSGTLTNHVTAYSKENATAVDAYASVEIEPVVLNINKTANVTVVGNNSLVNYTIHVSNFNNYDATDLKIADELPEGLTFVNATEGYSWNPSTRVISWNLTKLDAGKIADYYVLVRTNSVGLMTNRVNVTCAENRTERANTSTIEVKKVNLTVEKTTNLIENARKGEKFQFAITVTNNGDANATDVTIRDEIPTVFEVVDCDNGQKDGNNVTWVIKRLDVGASKTVYVTVIANATGIYNNVAVVNCSENKTKISDDITVIVEPIVSFSIVKTATPEIVNVGDNVTFTITINNTGISDATNVNITDKLDYALDYDGMSYAGASSSYNPGDRTITWYIGELKKGETRTVSFNATVMYADIFINAATVNSTENTTGASNKTTVSAEPIVDLKINKTVDRNDVYVGEEVTYTITVTNLGPSPANMVEIEDVLSDNVEITYMSKDGIKDDNKNIISWFIESLDIDEEVEIKLTVKTLEVGTVENVVNMTSEDKEKNASNNNYTCENVTVKPYPSLVEGKNVTVTYGEQINVNYTSVNSTNVTYKIYNDKTGELVAEDTVPSNGIIAGLDLPAGNYTVEWQTGVDANHTTNSSASKITVNPAPSFVEGKDVNVTYGDAIDVKYSSLNSTNVTYKIYNETGGFVTGDTVPSNGTITGLNLPVGNYTVEWQTGVDANHTTNSSVSKITVNPAPSSVEGENVTAYAGESIAVPVNSDNATEIFYQIIKDGEEIINGTIKKGENITGLVLPVGNYTVNLTTVVDENHTAATNSSRITVLPAPSSVEGQNVTVTYGEPIIVDYTSDNATNVTYNLYDGDNNLITSGTIGPNGEITGLDLAVGNYTVKWETLVDDNHVVANNTSKITVNPAPSTVGGEDVTAYVGDPIVVPVTSENATSIIYQIIDKEGKVVGNGTLKPGQSIDASELPAGKYTVNLTTVTDENHTSATNTSSIIVKKLPSTVIPTVDDIYVGETAVIDIKVGPSDATGTVNITVAGKTYYDVPVVGGTAQITVPKLPAGKYTVDVSYSGDDKYLPSKNTTTFNVKKIVPPIKVDAPTIHVGDDGKITVTLPKDATGKVTIVVEGKSYTKTLKGGKAVFYVPGLKAGVHDIQVFYSGDDKYLPTNTTGTIEVLPGEDNPPIDKNEQFVEPGLSEHETGNPIMVLVLVLIALGCGSLRRFRK